MVHVWPARDGPPFGVVPQELQIETVQATRGSDIECAFADLTDCGDPRERKEESKVIREFPEGASYGLTGCEVLRLEVRTIRCEDKLRLGLCRRRARPQRGKGLCDFADRTDRDMNIIGLKNAG